MDYDSLQDLRPFGEKKAEEGLMRSQSEPGETVQNNNICFLPAELVVTKKKTWMFWRSRNNTAVAGAFCAFLEGTIFAFVDQMSSSLISL